MIYVCGIESDEMEFFKSAGAARIFDKNILYYFDESCDELKLFCAGDRFTLNEDDSIVIRSSSNSRYMLAYYASMVGCVLDRPIDAIGSSMPKVKSELRRNVGENKISWFVAFSKKAVTENIDKFFYPLVYKPVSGRHGKGISLLQNQQELLTKVGEHNWKYPIFLQEFIDKKFEYRIMAFDGKIVSWAKKMLKTKSGNQFGGRRFVKRDRLHSDYVNYVRDYAKQGLVGIDIVRDRHGKIIIIEQNRAPEFSALSRALDENVADKIINGLLEN